MRIFILGAEVVLKQGTQPATVRNSLRKTKNAKNQRKPTWWVGALPEHQSIEPTNDTSSEEDTDIVPQKTEQVTYVQEQEPPSPRKPKGKAQGKTDPTIMPGISQPEHQISSWADIADEEGPDLTDEEGPLQPKENQSHQSKEWQTVSKRKRKNFQVKKDVMTCSRTGSLKQYGFPSSQVISVLVHLALSL